MSFHLLSFPVISRYGVPLRHFGGRLAIGTATDFESLPIDFAVCRAIVFKDMAIDAATAVEKALASFVNAYEAR
jgi:hypothetical protein